MAATKFPFLGKAVAALVGVFYGRRNVESAGACFFEVERDITAAELIAGAVTILPDGEVPKGCKIFIDDYQIRWGGTAFGAATAVVLSDKNSSPVDFVSVLVANTVNAIHRLSPTGVTQTGVTQGAALITYASLGGTAEKGLQVRTTGLTPTLGSTFRIYVRGYFAKS